MQRTSVLLDDEKMARLRTRARRKGTTVTQEIRAAIDRVLDEEAEEPNPYLETMRRFDSLEGVKYGPHLPVDSDEAKLHAAREIYRDAMNREPDF
jgi:hypothetical protein